MILLAVVNGQPREMGLIQTIKYFIEHRVDVVRRRTAYLLQKAKDREHILEGYLNALDHLILPAATLSLIYFGIVTRVTRASVLEAFQKDFIRASYAKGLRRRTVILRHALRNALIPTVTVLGLLLAGLFGGSVVVETIFQWPGIGLYAYQSIQNFDFPSVMGVALILTIGVVLANLIADVLYAVLDPRIKV